MTRQTTHAFTGSWNGRAQLASAIVCIAFIAMYSTGLIFDTAWVSQTIGYAVLLPAAGVQAWYAAYDGGFNVRKRPLFWLILGCLALYFAVLLLSTTLNSFSEQTSPLIKLRDILIIWISIAAIGEAARRMPRFIFWFARSVIASAVIGATLLLYFSSLEGPVWAGRLNGVEGLNWFLNPNSVGAVYAMCLALLIGHILRRDLKVTETILVALAAFPILSVVILTESRASMLGCIAALGVAAFALRPKWAVTYFIALALAGLAVLIVNPDWAAKLLERGDANRLALWQHYLSQAMTRPFLGHGLDFDVRFYLGDELIYTPHNIVLAAWVRGGLVGLAVLLVLLAAAGYQAMKAASRRNWLPATTLASFVVICMFDHEMIPDDFSFYWYVFWLPLSMVATVQEEPIQPG